MIIEETKTGYFWGDLPHQEVNKKDKKDFIFYGDLKLTRTFHPSIIPCLIMVDIYL